MHNDFLSVAKYFIVQNIINKGIWSMKVIHFIEFSRYHLSHEIFDDLKKVKSAKQIKQSETRPKTTEKKCLKNNRKKKFFRRRFH